MVTEQSPRRVEIRISRNALRHNLATVKEIVGDDVKVFAVVKADAYGHGDLAVVEALLSGPEAGHPDALAVATPGEAVRLRDAGIKIPILVLHGGLSAADYTTAAELDLWLTVHEKQQLDTLIECQHNFPKTLEVVVKCDTGMGRLGFMPDEMAHALETLGGLSSVRVLGLTSHFACADEPSHGHTQEQLDNFTALALPTDLWRSIANSAATVNRPDTHFEWVRPGIMLYGAEPLRHEPEFREGRPTGQVSRIHNYPLKPVMQVSAPLISVKNIHAGQTIGYGQTYWCETDCLIGFVGIGYGDGLPRVLDNAWVCVGGRPVPVVGRVSMDSIAIDLTGMQAVPGERVTIFGGEGLPVEYLASAAGTISYELLCQIRGTRIYTDD